MEMKCNECSHHGDNFTVPFVVHEASMERIERMARRLWICVILLILLLVGSNVAWLAYESQFTDDVITVSQENADGYNNFIGNDGDIVYGNTDDYD